MKFYKFYLFLKANCSESSIHRIKNVTIELLPGYDRKLFNFSKKDLPYFVEFS